MDPLPEIKRQGVLVTTKITDLHVPEDQYTLHGEMGVARFLHGEMGVV